MGLTYPATYPNSAKFKQGFIYVVVLNNDDGSTLSYSLFVPELSSVGIGIASGYLIYLAKNSDDLGCENINAHYVTLGSELLLVAQLADVSDYGRAQDITDTILETRFCSSRFQYEYESPSRWISSMVDELHEVGMLDCMDPEAFELELVNAAKIAYRAYRRTGSCAMIVSKHCKNA